ncbi:MAG: sel1 repeat family protein [Deltaproteobacteria bacterium]|jgi:hypothetical protein|nr:sel1 repeat family protein [Deltaproteobacteria bacterium]
MIRFFLTLLTATVMLSSLAAADNGNYLVAQYDHGNFTRHQDDQTVFETGRDNDPTTRHRSRNDQYFDADNAFEQRVEKLKSAADKGDLEAMTNLGVMYLGDPNAGPQEHTQGVKYLQQAADEGYASAQAKLANVYYFGQAAPRDLDKCIELLKSSVEGGNADAQFMLGVMYVNGEGVVKDHTEATRLFKLAAEQGQPSAIEILKQSNIK